MKISMFWYIMANKQSKVNRQFGEACRLHIQGRIRNQVRNKLEEGSKKTCLTLVYCLAYYSTVEIEVICSTEPSIDFQVTTRRYIAEELFINHRFIQLKSYTDFGCLRTEL
jgi:hypothetical protein